MYALAFDLKIEILKKEYGEPYNKAYDDLRQELELLGFENTQGSVYVNYSKENTLAQVYKAINKLSQIEWFKKSVRDIRAFKVENFSGFTEIVKSQCLAKFLKFLALIEWKATLFYFLNTLVFAAF